MLHIVREALSNAARHSAATHVDVVLRWDGDGLSITVADNGRGFEPTEVGGAGHFGLANMAARAASVGGALTVNSAPTTGTRIIVWMPVAHAGKDSLRE